MQKGTDEPQLRLEEESQTPQPAKPVKVPSDEDIIALALANGMRQSSEHWGDRYYTELGSDLVGFARALLAKYGRQP